jgi:hypothetical protein
MHLPSVISRPVLIAAPWLCILAAWFALPASGLVSPALVPTPGAVLHKFIELSKDRLWLDIWMSTRRLFIGVTLGILVAVPVGFCLGWYRGLRVFIDPVINFFRALPPIALISLVIVYFGIGEPAKTVILFYASFFAGVIVMYEGIAQISPIFVRVAKTLGANDVKIFAKVSLIAAWGEANDAIVRSPDAAAETLQKTQYKDVALAEFKAQFKQAKYFSTAEWRTKYADGSATRWLQQVTNFFAQSGNIASPVPAERYFDPELYLEAIKA